MIANKLLKKSPTVLRQAEPNGCQTEFVRLPGRPELVKAYGEFIGPDDQGL